MAGITTDGVGTVGGLPIDVFDGLYAQVSVGGKKVEIGCLALLGIVLV